jgi:hypothetical protein
MNASIASAIREIRGSWWGYAMVPQIPTPRIAVPNTHLCGGIFLFLLISFSLGQGKPERVRRIGLPSDAWEASTLPLSYTRERHTGSDPVSPPWQDGALPLS